MRLFYLNTLLVGNLLKCLFIYVSLVGGYVFLGLSVENGIDFVTLKIPGLLHKGAVPATRLC